MIKVFFLRWAIHWAGLVDDLIGIATLGLWERHSFALEVARAYSLANYLAHYDEYHIDKYKE